MDKKYLLTSVQMANFVADGLLRFDELVPKEINEEAMRELDEERISSSRAHQGKSVMTLWPESKGFGAMIRLPQVQGILYSLVGPNTIYDHHAFHKVPPGQVEGQIWHSDSHIDTLMRFDIQLFYFPHDTPREMGGTMFLPGSHFRRIHESDIARYQNFIGQMPVVCKAGTLLIGHHSLWHCAQPNYTERLRYMFKLRLNPTVRQMRLWNTEDLHDPQIEGILSRDHVWYGNDDRLEYVNRIKLWRFLTGNERYDLHYWLTRLENSPETRVSA